MTIGIDRFKASSHPTQQQGIYLGVVKTVTPDKKAYVYIPKFLNTVGPMRCVSGFPLVPDAMVLCAHVGGGNEEMYIIGTTNNVDAFMPHISFPSYNDTLIYDGTNWANIPAFRPTIETPSTGQTLQYNGTNWLNVGYDNDQAIISSQMFG